MLVAVPLKEVASVQLAQIITKWISQWLTPTLESAGDQG